MFTGIVESLGRVLEFADRGNAGARLRLDAAPLSGVSMGESVCVSGACLTVAETNGSGLAFDLSPETLDKTTLGALRPGQAVNLERALRAGDRLGGHFVSGHVDGKAKLETESDTGGGKVLEFSVPVELARFIAEKGSVCLAGVSLTPFEARGRRFKAALIPHTLSVTTLGGLKPGDEVNLEVDLLARYLDRLLQAKGSSAEGASPGRPLLDWDQLIHLAGGGPS